MKSSLLLVLMLFGVAVWLPNEATAQSNDRLPPFNMTLSNGRFFKAADIPAGKPVVLIYFAPDCDHCHTLMNAFFQKAGEFKTAEVVMVTFKPVSEVRTFEQSFQTARYPNIKVGTEGNTNFLRLFYKLQNTPFTALYNRDGKLVVSYRKETPVDELVKQLKKL
jgi:thiol-disulfide isomerase/thioredoxin